MQEANLEASNRVGGVRHFGAWMIRAACPWRDESINDGGVSIRLRNAVGGPNQPETLRSLG
jgi:hypothetical protein